MEADLEGLRAVLAELDFSSEEPRDAPLNHLLHPPTIERPRDEEGAIAILELGPLYRVPRRGPVRLHFHLILHPCTDFLVRSAKILPLLPALEVGDDVRLRALDLVEYDALVVQGAIRARVHLVLCPSQAVPV